MITIDSDTIGMNNFGTVSISLTEQEQQRFNALPPITPEQQKVIDMFAKNLLELIKEENHE